MSSNLPLATRGGDAIHALHGHTMGTTWSVRVVAASHADLHPLHAAVQATLDRVVSEMSDWEVDSDISRFNRAAAGSWHRLPEGFARVMACAVEVAEASDGAFDPTLGAVRALWGFGADARTAGVPDADALHRARAQAGWRRLSFADGGASLLQPGGLQLDLSAIAKGHGVDAVAATLRERGVVAALIEVGGELYGFGRKPDGSAWQVSVETQPDDDSDEDPCVLSLDGLAVATSGDHWHHFEADGRRYSHSIDPRSGSPVVDAPRAVTVLDALAMRADAWATALTVMGMEAGFRFASDRGLAARFEGDGVDGKVVRVTPAFLAHVR